MAGHETTANTITFAILELCKNQDIQEKLYQSVKQIQLTKEGDSIPLINPSEVKYLDNFFKEVQRLHSIVHRIPRQCKDNMEIQGKSIPNGSVIHIYLKGIHLNPR